MHIKTIASAAALSVALGFSGFAYGQTMIGNQNVSEADMERVKVHCADLEAAEAATEGASSTESEVEATNDAAAAADSDPADVGAIDMDAITLENCKEGGWLEAAAQ